MKEIIDRMVAEVKAFFRFMLDWAKKFAVQIILIGGVGFVFLLWLLWVSL